MDIYALAPKSKMPTVRDKPWNLSLITQDKKSVVGSSKMTGDIMLVEQVDRISRLNTQDWELLKSQIISKGIRIIALDLPTSHQFINTNRDKFTQRMLSAINSMMLDMLAAVARKDYEDRRRRQFEGIAQAKVSGKYKGRAMNPKLHETIATLLSARKSYTDIVNLLGCSRSTISKIRKTISKL